MLSIGVAKRADSPQPTKSGAGRANLEKQI